MGDALNALRPQRLRTKAASSLLPHWLFTLHLCLVLIQLVYC
ncbi:hypothetical protein [Bathymodiolus japonicus methanotrophic gill symbiont]|nr:hypothetical protein [Bathymodiolus japonicus methanotrophic gill symbiont]